MHRLMKIGNIMRNYAQLKNERFQRCIEQIPQKRRYIVMQNYFLGILQHLQDQICLSFYFIDDAAGMNTILIGSAIEIVIYNIFKNPVGSFDAKYIEILVSFYQVYKRGIAFFQSLRSNELMSA
jgi:hypothetical protein